MPAKLSLDTNNKKTTLTITTIIKLHELELSLITATHHWGCTGCPARCLGCLRKLPVTVQHIVNQGGHIVDIDAT